MSEPKTVKIKIDAEVYEKLEKDAEKRGLTVNEFAEYICRKHMDRLEVIAKELINAEKEEEQ